MAITLDGSAPSYGDILNYLYSRLPMFTRIGDKAIRPDLTNTLNFCRELGNPHQKFRSVHVGGTNGKGSTSHMLASVLQTAGYKTGLYTSPHLKDFRERIRVNGSPIPEQEVIDFVKEHQGLIESMDPSFFEVTVAMAFDHFAKQQVDIAIIEVGLGGRLDSTNVINPLLSIITNIGFDHVALLGNTLPLIASEKAGIIKQHIPVIIGEQHPETLPVFREKARVMQAELSLAEDNYSVQATENGDSDYLTLEVAPLRASATLSGHLSLDLSGTYQLKNVPAVLSAFDVLKAEGYHISGQAIRSGLAAVKENTGLMGRWQTLQKDPLVICDTGHNEDGIREVIKNIARQRYQNLHIVLGMVSDKDAAAILQLLPKNAEYYFCQPNLPRARPAKDLQQEASGYGLSGNVFQSVAEALAAALSNASKQDLIFVGGSTFVVAEVV